MDSITELNGKIWHGTKKQNVSELPKNAKLLKFVACENWENYSIHYTFSNAKQKTNLYFILM